MTPNFTVDEFTRTDHRTIDNSLPDALRMTAKATLLFLERVRACLSAEIGEDCPITITSGYRCLELNRAIGSKDSSDHLLAQAVDFVAPKFGTPLQVAQLLQTNADKLDIGQLIHEFGRWVHVSTRPVRFPSNRIITIDRLGTRMGILEAR